MHIASESVFDDISQAIQRIAVVHQIDVTTARAMLYRLTQLDPEFTLADNIAFLLESRAGFETKPRADLCYHD